MPDDNENEDGENLLVDIDRIFPVRKVNRAQERMAIRMNKFSEATRKIPSIRTASRMQKLSSQLQKASAQHQPALDRMRNIVEKMRKAFLDYPDILRNLENAARKIADLPERQRRVLENAAIHGWYINWHTPFPSLMSSGETGDLDAFMIDHLENDWGEICESIIAEFPNRKEILGEAFKLHEEGRYIASIPLCFAQADGICSEALRANLFFERDKLEGAVARIVEGREETLIEALVETLKVRSQMHAGSSKYQERKKRLGPSRAGVMHGSRRHLDYGTYVNSLKSFSLLAFVAFALSNLPTEKSHE